ncbi:MAG: translesion error-prone DNA polymerase V autoproteolytic subunit [Xenophilus sp.]
MNSISRPADPLPADGLSLPMAGATVHAGFPSPADDFRAQRIDLNAVLVTHPQATFVLRVAGDSMRDEGIDDGDLLVVDRALKPRHGQIVVAVVDGEFAVKRLHLRGGRLRLRAGNPTYPEIAPAEGQTVEVWGVATGCIKRFST